MHLSAGLKIPVCRLDDYIKQKALNSISLIKIDVEGLVKTDIIKFKESSIAIFMPDEKD